MDPATGHQSEEQKAYQDIIAKESGEQRLRADNRDNVGAEAMTAARLQARLIVDELMLRMPRS
jgi:hypothetical protein